MRIVNKIIERVGWDKALHFLAGFALTCCLALVCSDRLGMTAWQGAVCGFFAASLVGLAKELRLERPRGHGDRRRGRPRGGGSVARHIGILKLKFKIKAEDESKRHADKQDEGV